jgi:folate-dependent phosphoribosylglycinamide formyltransferase PurN
MGPEFTGDIYQMKDSIDLRIMKIAFLCQKKDASLFILEHINECAQVTALVIEEASVFSPVFKVLRRVFRDGIVKIIGRIAFLIYYAVFCKNHDSQDFKKVLSKAKRQEFQGSLSECVRKAVSVKNINQRVLVDGILSGKPDAVVVFGTSMLADRWFATDIPVINIHYGLSEYFRGSFCGFWTLYDRMYDKLGVTIHRVTRRVDAGNIIVQKVIPEEAARDLRSLGELLAFQALAAAEILPDALEIIRKKESQQRTGNGRLCFIPTLNDYLSWRRSH